MKKVMFILATSMALYSCNTEEKVSCNHPEVKALLKAIIMEELDSTRYNVFLEGVRTVKNEPEIKKCECSTDVDLYEGNKKLKTISIDYTGQFTDDDHVYVEILE